MLFSKRGKLKDQGGATLLSRQINAVLMYVNGTLKFTYVEEILF